MDSRLVLKTKFSSGQAIKESDFTALIESLAHLTEDVDNGTLARGSTVSSIQASMAALQALADQNKADIEQVSDESISITKLSDTKAELQEEISQSMTNLSSTQVTKHNEQDAQITSLEGKVAPLESDVEGIKVSLSQGIYELKRDYVSKTYHEGQETYLENYIATKSDLVHNHEQYLEVNDIADFVTDNELVVQLGGFSPDGHIHSANEVSGLNDLFLSPAEVESLIIAYKSTLEGTSAFSDTYYSKDEVEEKFYVARWRTDQVSLFNPAVVSISQPLVNIAREEVKVSISNVRNELAGEVSTIVGEFAVVRDELTGVRQEVMVSIGNTNTAVTQNKLASEQADIMLQGKINQVSINASASIASSQTHVLAQLSSVRAEVLAETTSSNTDITALQGRATTLETSTTNLFAKDTALESEIADIKVSLSSTNTGVTQTLVDAKAYTDNSISSLVNGAGDALDTLKELGDALTSGDNTLATEITSQVSNLQSQINSSVVSLGNINTDISSHGTRLTSLEAKDSDISVSLGNIDTRISSNDTDISGLDTRATTLESRATTLESKDSLLDADIATLTSSIATLQSSYDTLLLAHNALLAAHNDLVVRMNGLEANAYAPWSPGVYVDVGYVYP